MRRPLTGWYLQYYERGLITRRELCNALIEEATNFPVEEIAVLLPSDVLDELRTLSETPPSSVASSPRMFYIRFRVEPPDENEKRLQQREREIWYQGVWNWHRYFNPS